MINAERLLDLAKLIKHPKDEVVATDDASLGKCALALRLDRAPMSLRLRAVVEDWSLPRIVQEIY